MKTDDKARVRRFERLDFKASELAKPEVTQDGFWKLEGKVARTGVQVYHDIAGGERRELRRPEEVKASVPGFALAPLTNGHPPRLVDPSTAQKYAAGAVGAAEYADGWVKAPITVWTADAIEAVRAGRAQLSVGYTCRLIEEKGDYQGEKYDSVQTEIVVNHVALVDAARAGPEARLRLDSGDAVTTESGSAFHTDVASSVEVDSTTKQGETKHMLKMTLDGLVIEVGDENAQSIITRALEKARKDGEDKAAAEKLRADAADTEVKRLTAELSTEKGRADTLDAASKKDVKCDECDGSGKIGEKGCDNCGGKGEMKADGLSFESRKASRARSENRAVANRAGARAALIAKVQPVLGANVKLDGKTDIEIKKLYLADTAKELKLDGKDDSYVEGCFEVALAKNDKAALRPIDRVKLVQDGAAPPPAKTGEGELTQTTDEGEVSPLAKQRAYYDSLYYKNQAAAK